MNRIKCNIVLGRFQPFTKGHEKILEALHSANGLPTVLLVISNTKFDAKHPFDDSVIMREMQECYKNNDMYKDTIFVKSADIGAFSAALHDKGYEPVLWGCGTDRYAPYKKMADKYKDRFGLLPEFDVYEIERTDDDISATKVREAIKANDIDTFKKMMPDGSERLFSTFKEQIEKITEAFVPISTYAWFKTTAHYDID